MCSSDLRFYRFVFYREVIPFIIWFYPPLVDYDVSLHDLVELVILFETSPSSSKTELGCSSYGCFRIATSASFQRGGDSGRESGQDSGRMSSGPWKLPRSLPRSLGPGDSAPRPETPVFQPRRLRDKLFPTASFRVGPI